MKPSNVLVTLPVSVIVPVWNGADTLGACLQALLAQSAQAASYEVIVVDDGSGDGSGKIAAQFGVVVIRQEHAGAAAARNRGVRHAQGEILLFTDADCEPLPDWIEQMLEPFADPDVMGVKGVYRTRQRSLVARFTQAEYHEKYGRLARSEWIDFVDTYSAGYRQDAFREHGGFDPTFLLDEDQEFSFRLAASGYGLKFAPGAAVYHQHPATAWDYAWRKVRLARWKVWVSMVHPAKVIRDSYTPWTQKAQIAALLLTTMSVVLAVLGVIPWLFVLASAVMGLVFSVPLVVSSRQQGWLVVIIAPAMIGLRALALATGLVWGIVDRILKKPSLWISQITKRRGDK